ncbi:unnamed protein product [Mytilus coruscus]|uniref:Ig-like domain-containing protein n=1 Tax=Mytilus coruscus TaxID=42192 RepID=A0A6J8A5F3_MYTCO|nr:unnamed protein product [Mytilus coruscus]
MKLVCNVESGLPPETIWWKMNGKSLKKGGPRRIVYEFYPNRSVHYSNFTCEVMNNVTEKPLSKSIRLDIKYKPEVLIGSEPLVTSDEGSKKKLCCEIDSNPNVIFMFWYKDVKTRIKNNSSLCLVLEEVTRQDSGNYTCLAGNEIGNGSSTASLVVFYPPTVYVEYNNFSIYKNKRYVYCKADGVPNNFTFFRLEHKSLFNEHIRYLEVTSDGIAELPHTDQSHSYQDTGLYMCNVSNGVSDRRGKPFQQGEAYLVYNGPPVFVADNMNIQYGQIGKPLSIAVNIYSSSDIKCYHLNGIGKISSSLKTKETLKTNVTIRINFHDVNITANGMQLTFRLVRLHSFQRYNVTVCNNFSNASFIVDVRKGGETPIMTNDSTALVGGCVMFGVITLVIMLIIIGISQSVENIVYQSVQQDQAGIEHPSPASTLLPDIGSENTDTLSHSMDETNQSMGILLNYADVVFQPSSQNEVRIIGLEDRTVYADVDTSFAAAFLPEKQSETSSSEDDFIYVDGIENFIDKRETND